MINYILLYDINYWKTTFKATMPSKKILIQLPI